jgi:hypothetical protein
VTEGEGLAPRGWHRPISRAQLLGVSLAVLALWLAAVGLAAWAFWQHWEARLVLHDQPLSLSLPVGLRAQAEVAAPLVAPLDIHPRIPIRLDQTLSVQLEDALAARVQIHAVLPVDTVVSVVQDVAVATEVSLQVPLVRWLPAFTVTVPLRLVLPFKLEVPVTAQVPVDLDLAVSGRWPERIAVPLHANMVVQPRVRGQVSATLLRRVDFSLLGPVPPVDLMVSALSLSQPVRDVGLLWAQDAGPRPWWWPQPGP